MVDKDNMLDNIERVKKLLEDKDKTIVEQENYIKQLRGELFAEFRDNSGLLDKLDESQGLIARLTQMHNAVLKSNDEYVKRESDLLERNSGLIETVAELGKELSDALRNAYRNNKELEKLRDEYLDALDELTESHKIRDKMIVERVHLENEVERLDRLSTDTEVKLVLKNDSLESIKSEFRAARDREKYNLKTAMNYKKNAPILAVSFAVIAFCLGYYLAKKDYSEKLNELSKQVESVLENFKDKK